MRTVRKRSALAYVIGALIGLSVLSDIPESKTSTHSVLYRLWRIMFFPIAMLCLFIVGGARGVVTWVSFGLIVLALRYIPIGRSSGT